MNPVQSLNKKLFFLSILEVGFLVGDTKKASFAYYDASLLAIAHPLQKPSLDRCRCLSHSSVIVFDFEDEPVPMQ